MDWNNFIFGPLEKESCKLFYFFTALSFFSIVLFIISFILYSIKQPKNISISTILNCIILLVNLLVTYFVNRIFYNICQKVL